MPSRKFLLCTGECVPADRLADHYPDSHIIGELRYIKANGKRVTALALYECSFSKYPEDYPAILVNLIGDARGIRCTQCNNVVKRWEAGRAAMDAIIERARNYGVSS